LDVFYHTTSVTYVSQPPQEKDPELRSSMASSTNLAILCAAICNAVEMQQKIRYLKSQSYEITPDELKFLAPFAHSHFNFLGRYNFKGIPEISLTNIEKQFKPLF